jgi:hypothetical protein
MILIFDFAGKVTGISDGIQAHQTNIKVAKNARC